MSITVKEFDAIMKAGKSAEGRIGGVLRGGFVLDGVFYAPASVNVGVLSAPVENVSELKIR